MTKKKKDTVTAETPATKTKTETAPTLLWNERGQIGCTLPGHAPHKGSDSWKFEHWKKLPPGTLNDDGQPFACEVCKAGAAATESIPEAATTLYVNELGAIECEKHAPREGTQTWKLDGWHAMSSKDIEALGAGFNRERACATCGYEKENEKASLPAEKEPETPKKKGGRKTKADLTLADLAERYVAHLEEAGKSAGTSASYGLELKTALGELGAETKLGDLTPAHVLAFFGSARVMKKKNGKHKSPLSIAKTQRVLRLALVWAVEKKLIEKAPLPEELATH
jgi:hypothetical protein